MSKHHEGISLDKISHRLFERAAEGLAVVDQKGNILIANPRMHELFGYAEGEMTNLKVEALIPHTLRKNHVAHRKSYHKSAESRTMGQGLDLIALRKDESTFPVEISLNHLELDGMTYVMALITDISDRKKIQDRLHQLNAELEDRVAKRTEALRESQQLYSTIAKNFPNGTINVFDRNLNYIFVDGQELSRIGIDAQHLIGTSYSEHLPEHLRNDITQRLQGVFEGRNTQFEVTHDSQIYALNAVALRAEQGTIEHILVVEQNITKQKNAEVETRNALEKEKQLNVMKSRFVSMASHEFRTPLSTILSSVSLIHRYSDPNHEEKRNKHIDRIKTSVHNLTGILNDFLSIDKLETGKLELKPAPFNWSELVNEVMEEMQGQAKKDQLIVFQHEHEETLIQDHHMLRNVLINLLSNAIKYSKEGDTITITSTQSSSGLQFSIKDEGMGIPEQEQDQLFQRFFRAQNTTNIQGTGLGLNIVKRYVELMQGQIRFESTLGAGSTFHVNIPQIDLT